MSFELFSLELFSQWPKIKPEIGIIKGPQCPEFSISGPYPLAYSQILSLLVFISGHFNVLKIFEMLGFRTSDGPFKYTLLIPWSS